VKKYARHHVDYQVCPLTWLAALSYLTSLICIKLFKMIQAYNFKISHAKVLSDIKDTKYCPFDFFIFMEHFNGFVNSIHKYSRILFAKLKKILTTMDLHVAPNQE
jgi:hypothetical protein